MEQSGNRRGVFQRCIALAGAAQNFYDSLETVWAVHSFRLPDWANTKAAYRFFSNPNVACQPCLDYALSSCRIASAASNPWPICGHSTRLT
ncbi:transposase DNA-binding-containing protein [Rhizobium sp. 1399]|uniref:transposase DNA-binding-containing protein n=1 Tax=Rhizobium sp. 1399 TaxID=2817758 RepID=UPI00386E9A18